MTRKCGDFSGIMAQAAPVFLIMPELVIKHSADFLFCVCRVFISPKRIFSTAAEMKVVAILDVLGLNSPVAHGVKLVASVRSDKNTRFRTYPANTSTANPKNAQPTGGTFICPSPAKPLPRL
jgi:hypothetical protein